MTSSFLPPTKTLRVPPKDQFAEENASGDGKQKADIISHNSQHQYVSNECSDELKDRTNAVFLDAPRCAGYPEPLAIVLRVLLVVDR